jgi:hypothetical protein
LLSPALSYGRTQLSYHDYQTDEFLGNILRTRLFDDLTVDCEGNVLAWPLEPLRWELTEPADGTEDYSVRLVDPAGSGSNHSLRVFRRSPSLPDGQGGLHRTAAQTGDVGPEQSHHYTGASHQAREGTDLPEIAPGIPRAARKSSQPPYKIQFRCELVPVPYGAEGEDCVITVLAQAEDKRQLMWTGYNWLDTTPKAFRKACQNADLITIYDSSVLARVPPVLEPLNLRPIPSGLGLFLRVKKNFGDVFGAWLQAMPPEFEVQLQGTSCRSPTAGLRTQVGCHRSRNRLVRLARGPRCVRHSPYAKIQLLLKAKGRFVRQGKEVAPSAVRYLREDDERSGAVD